MRNFAVVGVIGSAMVLPRCPTIQTMIKYDGGAFAMNSAGGLARKPRSDELTETLSILSLKAAIQLDRMIRGEAADKTSIRKLTTKLKATPSLELTDGPRGLLLDPGKMMALRRATSKFTGHELKSIDELITGIRTIAESLEESDLSPNAESLRKLLQFCLALHKELLPRRGPKRDEWRTTD